MILTVTLNPSIDISYPLDHLHIDDVNRIKQVRRTAGGKGLNVARVVSELEEDVIATGFVGGNYGEELKQLLDRDGIQHDFTPIAGDTRECIAILHDDGNQTEILEAGPTISQEERSAFIENFKRLIQRVEVVAFSGSLPQGLKPGFYAELIALCHKQGVKTLLDTSNASLEASLHAKETPYLIKPNESELEALLGKSITNGDELKQCLQDDLLSPIECVVVSLGKGGALGKFQDHFFKANIPHLPNVVNPVGSGDATIAGFAVAIQQGLKPKNIMKYGMTCGMLNALEATTGHIDRSRFQELFDQIDIKEV
ncbi:MAG: hexose kinase [Aerococcus sp.]|nr:hexose kinase [Aerococcus sp.]